MGTRSKKTFLEKETSRENALEPMDSVVMGEPTSLAVHDSTVFKAVRAENRKDKNKQVCKNGMAIFGKTIAYKWS